MNHVEHKKSVQYNSPIVLQNLAWNKEMSTPWTEKMLIPHGKTSHRCQSRSCLGSISLCTQPIVWTQLGLPPVHVTVQTEPVQILKKYRSALSLSRASCLDNKLVQIYETHPKWISQVGIYFKQEHETLLSNSWDHTQDKSTEYAYICVAVFSLKQ